MRRREPKPLTIRITATEPGHLEVQFPVFFRCFPRWPLLLVACCLAAGGLTWITPPEMVEVPAMIMLGSFAFTVVASVAGPLRVKDHFRFGAVNPAVIISHDPDLIAVYSDLSAGGAPWPVVKILAHPLKRMTGGRPPVGTRLATMALYRGPARQFRWTDLFPVAVNAATADIQAIERIFGTIGGREWMAIEVALQQVPTPHRPGLYKVELPDSLHWT